MVGTISVQRTGNQDIDGVLSASRWNGLNLNYSFPTDAAHMGSAYGSGETQNNFAGLTALQTQAARKVVGVISSLTNLTFTEIQETQANHATLRMARSDEPEAAWTYLPGDYAEAGDSWFGNSSGWFDDPVQGDYAYYVFMHEILHAIGLKHGNETGGFGAMTSGRDSMEYSVMTYRSYVGAPGQYLENEDWGFAQTPMMIDIAALQHLYSANYGTHAGNTVYRWDSATGRAFIDGIGQDVPGGNRVFMSIWDGGGVDTYDLSNYTTGLRIDLRPGEWSRLSSTQTAMLGEVNPARGNVANAMLYKGDVRSLIENAIGGPGGDVIIGNQGGNLLKGGGGGDKLSGLTGSDTLVGGAGKDSFVFETRPSSGSLDRICDFSVADDTIILENAVFTKVGSAGKLSTSAFWVGSKAHDSTDRVVYDKGLGNLTYYADGTGTTAPVQFALLPKGLSMTAADFIVA
ncbi:M10 family metallopeptidase [Microvirga sp. 2YAF29]|uniref:M10 family metallopeptidase n=1 Tax=Microvirga sp. 2YAF29 TaxID=3233031 RepID=UPI003F94B2FB